MLALSPGSQINGGNVFLKAVIKNNYFTVDLLIYLIFLSVYLPTWCLWQYLSVSFCCYTAAKSVAYNSNTH